MNTSVQVHKTERYNKATDLAEMGITYYKIKIDRLVTAAFIGKTLKSQAELPILLEGIAKEIGEIGRADSEHKVAGNDLAYEIRDLAVDFSQINKLAVSFKSVGKADGDKRELTLGLTYTINEGRPIPVYTISDPGEFRSSSTDCHYGNNKISNMQCFYKPGQSVPSVKIEYSTLKIIGNEDFDHFSNVSSSNIYVSGDILLSKMNNITDLKIHITGNLNKNATPPDFTNFKGNTIIEIEQSASINKLNNLSENLLMVVGKDLLIEEMSNNTKGTIIVYGDARIDTIGTNSNMKVCVFGKYSGHQPKPSFINVYGEKNFLEDTVCGQYATGGIPVTLEANPEESISYH